MGFSGAAASLRCPSKRATAAASCLQALPEAVLEATTVAVVQAKNRSTEQLRHRLSAAARGVHEHPTAARLWYQCALTAKAAVLSGTCDGNTGVSMRAERWCRAAQHVLGSCAAAAAH